MMKKWEVHAKLTAAAMAAGSWLFTTGGEPALIRLLAAPDFGAAGKVHDWRNHVDEAVAAVWDALGTQAQLVAFIAAAKAASAEEWE